VDIERVRFGDGPLIPHVFTRHSPPHVNCDPRAGGNLYGSLQREQTTLLLKM